MKKPDNQLTFDFGDGNGPVPAHHHLNPDGSVSDTAWVSDTAQVYDNAWVFGNTLVYGNAWVYGTARVFEGEHAGSQEKAVEPEIAPEITVCHGDEPGPFCRKCGANLAAAPLREERE